MRRIACTSLACLVSLWSLLGSSPAGAEDGAEDRAHDILGQFGVGVKIGVNANLLSEPSEELIDLPVPGFFGISWGGGLVIEGLYRDFIGLELDILLARTSGTGEITFGGILDVEQKLTSLELQIDALVRLQLPSGTARPFLALGPAFVIQLDSEYTIDETYIVNPPDTSIDTESYVMLAVGLGVILDFTRVRIPIEIRGAYQPLDDDPTERADWEPEMGGALTHLGVRSAWEGQIWILTGCQYSLIF